LKEEKGIHIKEPQKEIEEKEEIKTEEQEQEEEKLTEEPEKAEEEKSGESWMNYWINNLFCMKV